MSLGEGKKRLNVRLTEELFEELQQEAAQTNQAISEVIVASLLAGRQAIPRQLQELHQLIDTEFATIQQILSQVIAVLESLKPEEERQKLQEVELERHIMTTEEMEAMYRETAEAAAAAEALTANQRAVKSPEPRRPWWHRLIFSS
jgi:hypothetical protein